MARLWIRRALAGIAILAFFAIATVLSLSDRIGESVQKAKEVTVSAGQEVEQQFDVDLRKDWLPFELDTIGHFLLWGSGMLLVGWLTRRRVPLFITALLLGACSLLFELGQATLATSRAFEARDAMANFIGIAIAGIVVAAVAWLFDDRAPDDRAPDDRAPDDWAPAHQPFAREQVR